MAIGGAREHVGQFEHIDSRILNFSPILELLKHPKALKNRIPKWNNKNNTQDNNRFLALRARTPLDPLIITNQKEKNNKKNTDFSILTQNDFRSNVFILVVCFVPAPNNNKLEVKKDDKKYRFQYSEALSPISFPRGQK